MHTEKTRDTKKAPLPLGAVPVFVSLGRGDLRKGDFEIGMHSSTLHLQGGLPEGVFGLAGAQKIEHLLAKGEQNGIQKNNGIYFKTCPLYARVFGRLGGGREIPNSLRSSELELRQETQNSS